MNTTTRKHRHPLTVLCALVSVGWVLGLAITGVFLIATGRFAGGAFGLLIAAIAAAPVAVHLHYDNT